MVAPCQPKSQNKKTYDNTYIVPSFNSQKESITFPALPDINESKEVSLASQLIKNNHSKQSKKAIVPSVKIMGLQHNMVQFYDNNNQ